MEGGTKEGKRPGRRGETQEEAKERFEQRSKEGAKEDNQGREEGGKGRGSGGNSYTRQATGAKRCHELIVDGLVVVKSPIYSYRNRCALSLLITDP